MSERKTAAVLVDPSPGASTREVVAPPSDLLALSKAEIDLQIATAKQFPRNLMQFQDSASNMVAYSPEVAETMYYKLPRKNKDGSTKLIEGPSVRFAEIIAQNWRNCRVGARVVGTEEKHVVSQGVFHDLETNVAISFEIKRRITDREGRRYNDDMISTTGAAAAGIAFRNAVLKGVPKMFWNGLYERALAAARPVQKDLVARRNSALEAFQKIGVSEAAILETLEVKSVSKIGAEELVTLRGIWNAIKEGSTTAAEAFSLGPKPLEPTTEISGKKGKAVKAPKKNPGSDRVVIGTNEQTAIYNLAIQNGWQVPEQVIAFLKAKYKIASIRDIAKDDYAAILARVRKPPTEDIL